MLLLWPSTFNTVAADSAFGVLRNESCVPLHCSYEEMSLPEAWNYYESIKLETMTADELIQPELLLLAMTQGFEHLLSGLASDLPTCEELEKRYTQLVLDHTGGNRKEAAPILGKSIGTVWRRLKNLDDLQKQLT